MKKHNKITTRKIPKGMYFVGLLIFVFFLFLTYLFPYTGDDWTWGSKMGIERLQFFFRGYNGRYAGNLLVLLLTRSKLINMLLMSLSSVALCALACVYCKTKHTYMLVLSFLFYLLMPRGVFTQSIVWTSGFANYIPSAMLSFIYICLSLKKSETGKEPHPIAESALCFLLSFVGGLFIEHVSLFNVFIAGVVILLSLIKFRKLFPSQIAYAAGTVAACVVMFVNPVYLSILRGKDEYNYRSVPKSNELLLSAKENMKISLENLVLDNYILCLIICIVLILLSVKVFKNLSVRRKAFLIPFGLLLLISSVFVTVNSFNEFPFVEQKMALLYLVAVFCVTVCITESKYLLYTITPFICSMVLIVPLLVTNPIGPRCFFFSYFLLIVFLLQLINRFDFGKIKVFNGVFAVATVSAFVLLTVHLFVPYTEIHKVDTERNLYAKYISENNLKVCEFCPIPYPEYIHCSEVTNEPWSTRYKLFHNLDEDIVFEYHDREYFEKILSEKQLK